jgi:hypothetical protein
MNVAPRGNIWVFYLAARAAIDGCDSPEKADGLVPDDLFEPDANDEDRCQQSDATGRHEGRTRRGARNRTRDKVVSRGSIC